MVGEGHLTQGGICGLKCVSLTWSSKIISIPAKAKTATTTKKQPTNQKHFHKENRLKSQHLNLTKYRNSLVPRTIRSLALVARHHPVTTDRPFQLFSCLLQYEGTAAARAAMGEASKRDFAERHNAVLLTVLVPRLQKEFHEDSKTLLNATLQQMN